MENIFIYSQKLELILLLFVKVLECSFQAKLLFFVESWNIDREFGRVFHIDTKFFEVDPKWTELDPNPKKGGVI